MSQSSPEGIILGKGSVLKSLDLSINKEKVLSIAQEQDKKLYNEVFEWLAHKDYLSDEVEIIQKEFEQFKNK